MNRALRWLLALWVLGYLLISCGPMLAGNVAAGGLGLVAGGLLLVPWLIGVLVLAVLIWLTNPRKA